MYTSLEKLILERDPLGHAQSIPVTESELQAVYDEGWDESEKATETRIQELEARNEELLGQLEEGMVKAVDDIQDKLYWATKELKMYAVRHSECCELSAVLEELSDAHGMCKSATAVYDKAHFLGRGHHSKLYNT